MISLKIHLDKSERRKVSVVKNTQVRQSQQCFCSVNSATITCRFPSSQNKTECFAETQNKSVYLPRNSNDLQLKNSRVYVSSLSPKRGINKPRGQRGGRKLRIRKKIAFIKSRFAQMSLNNCQMVSHCTNSVEPKTNSYPVTIRQPIFKIPERTTSSTVENETQAELKTPNREEKSDELMKLLMDMYRCSRCPNLIVPEFYECSSGHCVCEECWVTMSHCTMCSKKSNFFRTRSLEKISALLKFPCRWRDYGCTERLAASNWRDHVDSCWSRSAEGNQSRESSDNKLKSVASVISTDVVLTDFEDSDENGEDLDILMLNEDVDIFNEVNEELSKSK